MCFHHTQNCRTTLTTAGNLILRCTLRRGRTGRRRRYATNPSAISNRTWHCHLVMIERLGCKYMCSWVKKKSTYVSEIRSGEQRSRHGTRCRTSRSLLRFKRWWRCRRKRKRWNAILHPWLGHGTYHRFCWTTMSEHSRSRGIVVSSTSTRRNLSTSTSTPRHHRLTLTIWPPPLWWRRLTSFTEHMD